MINMYKLFFEWFILFSATFEACIFVELHEGKTHRVNHG